jgi:hypothetical protein
MWPHSTPERALDVAASRRSPPGEVSVMSAQKMPHRPTKRVNMELMGIMGPEDPRMSVVGPTDDTRE